MSRCRREQEEEIRAKPKGAFGQNEDPDLVVRMKGLK